MVAGAVWFTLGMHFKGGDAGKKSFKAEKTQEELEREAALKAANKEVKLTLNSNEKKRIWAIILISAFQIIFWLFWYLAYLPAYYHWGTNMTWKVGSFTIPQTWFDAVKALFCIISGPLTAILWHKLESRPQGACSRSWESHWHSWDAATCSTLAWMHSAEMESQAACGS